MTPEKQTLLQNKYPKIFKKSEYETEPMDLWGFECNDGWFEIIDTLCNRIQKHVDRRINNIQDPEEAENLQVVAQQVKEKFGGLRFYVAGGDDITDSLISFAESISFKVCETCGNQGSKKNVGTWIHTSCDPCFEKRAWRQNEES